jgi:hypothetical protein
MKSKPYKLAVIKAESVERRSFSWIASDGKPFIELDAVDFDEDLLDSVFDLYQRVYSKINPNLLIQNKYALFKYTRWIILIDDTGNLSGFFLCKEHDKGIKLGLTAAENSKEAKMVIMDLNRKALNVPSVFGEVSPPLEKALIGYVPEVEASIAKQVLGPLKKINRIDKDNKHYWRNIKNIGEKQKMMVGKPIE